MKIYQSTTLLYIILNLVSCDGPVSVKSETKSVADTREVTNNPVNVNEKDSLVIQNEELTKIYCLAISDFLKEVKKTVGLTYDTLFFGNRKNGQEDDFPDIKLPHKIKETNIELIDPEIGKKLQVEDRSRVYINLIGWVDSNKAEFIFVTFSNGFEHQFDCQIDYKYNSKQSKFEFEKSTIERFKK